MDQIIEKQALLSRWCPHDREAVERELAQALAGNRKKIIVLDDDPTGVQTVHGVYVYTDWDTDSILDGMNGAGSMFYILTNSRGLTTAQTEKLHGEIARRIVRVSKETGRDFILMSRSDSTLRGHYPLETEVLRKTLESEGYGPVDGEIIMPFFLEGGRYTADNTHYVAEGDALVPAGQTEFAKDKTFGYYSSNLRDWVAEKTKGAFAPESVTCISLEQIRARDYRGIRASLDAVTGFNKVIVNAIDYEDVKVFATALAASMNSGKRFLFRTAAALPKVLGGIPDQPLLTRGELCDTANRNGGMVVIGSHVKKTTQQLEALRSAEFVSLVEFDQHNVVDDDAFQAEITRVNKITDELLRAGKTVVLYTRRERFDLNTGNKEDELRLAVRISDAVTGFVSSLRVRPNFIIAKGGITSSDVGTKGLLVKKALVIGQIVQGVPVWRTGAESRFPDMPYVIFPGNVGGVDALLEAVTIMQPNTNTV